MHPSQSLQEFLLAVRDVRLLGTRIVEGVDVAPAAEMLEEIERIPRAMFSSASVSSSADNFGYQRAELHTNHHWSIALVWGDRWTRMR